MSDPGNRRARRFSAAGSAKELRRSWIYRLLGSTLSATGEKPLETRRRITIATSAIHVVATQDDLALSAAVRCARGRAYLSHRKRKPTHTDVGAAHFTGRTILRTAASQLGRVARVRTLVGGRRVESPTRPAAANLSRAIFFPIAGDFHVTETTVRLARERRRRHEPAVGAAADARKRIADQLSATPDGVFAGNEHRRACHAASSGRSCVAVSGRSSRSGSRHCTRAAGTCAGRTARAGRTTCSGRAARASASAQCSGASPCPARRTSGSAPGIHTRSSLADPRFSAVGVFRAASAQAIIPAAATTAGDREGQNRKQTEVRDRFSHETSVAGLGGTCIERRQVSGERSTARARSAVPSTIVHLRGGLHRSRHRPPPGMPDVSRRFCAARVSQARVGWRTRRLPTGPSASAVGQRTPFFIRSSASISTTSAHLVDSPSRRDRPSVRCDPRDFPAGTETEGDGRRAALPLPDRSEC